MGRGRGKGKKCPVRATHEDIISGEDEKVPPAYKRRGRPQKPLKDDIEEKQVEMIDEKEDENANNANNALDGIKDVENQAFVENGRKRKRSSPAKENSIKDENSIQTGQNMENPLKFVGFRQNGSRRKNKPSRAGEVGVQCM